MKGKIMMNAKRKNQYLVLPFLVVSLCGLSTAQADTYKNTQTSTTNVDATNTGNNKDYKVAPVADDQAKGSKNDVEITRLIRREITKNDSLSTNAKNVKIITLNGTVTLRGPVNSEQEVATVTEAAQRHAVNNQVTCELEVKAKK